MSTSINRRIRERIAVEAARILREGEEAEYLRAKRRAARILGLRFQPRDLPSNREVRRQLDRLDAVLGEPEKRAGLRQMQLAACRLLRLLRWFDPRIVGTLAQSEVPTSEEIHLIVRCDTPGRVEAHLDAEGLQPVREKPFPGEAQDGRLIRLRARDQFPVVVDVFATSSIPRTVRMALGLEELESLLAQDTTLGNLDDELEGLDPSVDRFETYRFLLAPLEEVRGRANDRAGDALHHSLQVFDLAARQRPYDEEFLVAALVHDVGMSVEPASPIAASLELLEGLITHRTRRLLERLAILPNAAPRPGEAAADLEDARLLAELDHTGRLQGVPTSTLDEAIAYLRSIADGSRWELTTY